MGGAFYNRRATPSANMAEQATDRVCAAGRYRVSQETLTARGHRVGGNIAAGANTKNRGIRGGARSINIGRAVGVDGLIKFNQAYDYRAGELTH